MSQLHSSHLLHHIDRAADGRNTEYTDQHYAQITKKIAPSHTHNVTRASLVLLKVPFRHGITVTVLRLIILGDGLSNGGDFVPENSSLIPTRSIRFPRYLAVIPHPKPRIEKAVPSRNHVRGMAHHAGVNYRSIRMEVVKRTVILEMAFFKRDVRRVRNAPVPTKRPEHNIEKPPTTRWRSQRPLKWRLGQQQSNARKRHRN